MRLVMRDSMIFYRSFYEAIKELPLETQGEIYNAIFTYGLDFEVTELSGVSKTIWTLIKPQIDANIKRFENGKKPKNKQTESKTEAKNNQDESKTETNNNNNNNVNDNVNVNVKDKVINNIKDRKTSFAISLEPYLELYNREMLNNFYMYWTEHGEKDKKMRFEKEKSFDVKLRLLNWSKRSESFKQKEFKKEVLFVTPEGIEITDKLVLHVYQQTGKV